VSAYGRLLELRRKVAAMKAALAERPDDKGLAITILSAERRLRRAERAAFPATYDE
jgi:hypothetical protein